MADVGRGADKGKVRTPVTRAIVPPKTSACLPAVLDYQSGDTKRRSRAQTWLKALRLIAWTLACYPAVVPLFALADERWRRLGDTEGVALTTLGAGFCVSALSLLILLITLTLVGFRQPTRPLWTTAGIAALGVLAPVTGLATLAVVSWLREMLTLR